MPKPTQYRALFYKIAGRSIVVAGLARPGQSAKQPIQDVIDYLQTHRFHTLISLENPNKNLETARYTANQNNIQYNQDYAIEDFKPPTIAAMDDIYTIVRDNALNGRNTAIHCTAGLGRTGSILAGLKLKEMMLAMSSDDLRNLQNTENQLIQLGEFAEGCRNDGQWRCTSLVKQAVEIIRSQGGSYNVNYVENEVQIDRLCEYQTHLVKSILNERDDLQTACQASDLLAIQQKISSGATPTQDMFKDAYLQGNIDVMNALMQGGLLPTNEPCDALAASLPVQLFLELALSSAALETQVERFNQLPVNEQNNELLQQLNSLLIKIREFRSKWTNVGMPSAEDIQNIMKTIDTTIQQSNLNDHRGFVRANPVLREIAITLKVIINSVQWVCSKIYRLISNDKNLVHPEGAKTVLQQPDTATIIKIKAIKDTLNKLTHPSASGNPSVLPAPENKKAPGKKDS